MCIAWVALSYSELHWSSLILLAKKGFGGQFVQVIFLTFCKSAKGLCDLNWLWEGLLVAWVGLYCNWDCIFSSQLSDPHLPIPGEKECSGHLFANIGLLPNECITLHQFSFYPGIFSKKARRGNIKASQIKQLSPPCTQPWKPPQNAKQDFWGRGPGWTAQWV